MVVGCERKRQITSGILTNVKFFETFFFFFKFSSRFQFIHLCLQRINGLQNKYNIFPRGSHSI